MIILVVGGLIAFAFIWYSASKFEDCLYDIEEENHKKRWAAYERQKEADAALIRRYFKEEPCDSTNPISQLTD